MKNWPTIKEVGKQLDIPYTTLKRYIEDHGDFIKTDFHGKTQVVSPDSFDVIRKIRYLLTEKNWTKDQVQQALCEEYPLTVVVGKDESGVPLTAGEMLSQFTQMKQAVDALLIENSELKSGLNELKAMLKAKEDQDVEGFALLHSGIGEIQKELGSRREKFKRDRGMFKRIIDAIKNNE